MTRLSTRAAWLVGAALTVTLGCAEPAETSNKDAGATSDASIGADASDAPAPGEDTPPAADTSADAAEPDPPCPPAAAWQPGTPVYLEATTAWGLNGIQGNRFNVLDLEGDGWPDLIVRQGGGLNQLGPDGKARDTWILRNTGKGGFEDVTAASGLLQRRVDPKADEGFGATVWAAGDVDGDGDVDVYAGRTADPKDAKAETSEILLNDGKGHFTLGPADSAARFAGQASVPMSASFLDFDKDGDLDLWVVHNMPAGAQQPLQDRLLAGDGTGRFSDVTLATGLKTEPWMSVPLLNQGKGHSWAWAATACDLNNDGLEELMAASYGRAPNHLWRAFRDDKGKVRFANESVASGYAYDHRTDWTDNKSAQCHCADVPQDPGCATVPKPDPALCKSLKQSFGGKYRWSHADDREPWRLGGNSGTTVCGDINNDGWFDLLTTEIVHWDVGASADPSELLLNIGAAEVRMDRPGNEIMGLLRKDESTYWDHGDIAAALYDFDNDGWQDVHIAASDYPANRALLFHQKEPLMFKEVDPTDFFMHFRAAGVAAADFDRDGDLDVLTGHTRMRCEGAMGKDCQDDNQVHLHMNQLGGRWVQLDLVGGKGSNPTAIGARVEVEAAGVRQTGFVDGGHGQSSAQREHALHFGLGQGCKAQVRVVWPDAAASEQTFELAAGRRYRVVQGLAAVEVK